MTSLLVLALLSGLYLSIRFYKYLRSLRKVVKPPLTDWREAFRGDGCE